MEQKYGLGWRKDQPDMRDFVARLARAAPASSLSIPPAVDLRKTPWMPPIMDQSVTSSCVGNASSSIVRFMRRKMGQPDFQPSRLFTYYFARRLQGWESIDAGCYPRDAMKSLAANGVPSEDEWPFDVNRVNERPPQISLHHALADKAIKYTRMLRNDDLFHLKNSLHQGIPFMLGISVYSSFFDTNETGMVRMPGRRESYEGGHMLWACGYSDVDRLLACPNSWSEGWGDRGVCYLPYDYLRHEGLSDDFWRIEAVS
jgi:C1A family cysteine protease